MSPFNTIVDDPWSWDVNQLVAQICHSPALFQAVGRRSENFPDTVSLEAQLRNQEVTGATFLTALTSSSLRTELGIQNLGQRLALVSVIEFLRLQSVAYKQHAATAGVRSLTIDNEHEPALAELSGSPITTSTSGANDRKRRKVTHLTTLSLPVNRQPSHAVSAAMTNNPQDLSRMASNGEWDYLLRWDQANQGVIDDENMSGEGDVDGEELDETGEDAEEESVETLDGPEDIAEIPSRSKLSRDQIVDIINERIEHFTTTWKPNKGVLKADEVEYDPERMWEEAEATDKRQMLVEKYQTDTAYYRQRLNKLCDEILKSPGNNADRVRHQCANLEITINSIELSEWLLSIYILKPIDSDEEEERLQSRSPAIAHGRPEIPSPSEIPTANSPQQATSIIDLGSPSDSSQGEIDGVLVESSPSPEVRLKERQSSSDDRFHIPGSVVVNTVEPSLGDEPEKASIASARRWKWVDLVEAQDRKRIVTKALSEMKSDDRETIRSRLEFVGKAELIREISACIQMFAKREIKMQGVLARDLPKIVKLTKLFLCWWLCDNYFRVEPSKWVLEELEQYLQGGFEDPSTFYVYLNTIMDTTFSSQALQHSEQPSQVEIIEISDDDNEPSPRPSGTQRKIQLQRPQSSQHHTTIVLD